jgi:hypothetical protein
MPSDYVSAAFHAVCAEAVDAEAKHVCLYRIDTYYGGPEEGGWYGTDYTLVASHRFPSQVEAAAAAAQVEALAALMTVDARRAHAVAAAAECDWLDARGLDADYLPESDGPERFVVFVDDRPGQRERQGCRHYE